MYTSPKSDHVYKSLYISGDIYSSIRITRHPLGAANCLNMVSRTVDRVSIFIFPSSTNIFPGHRI